MSNYNDIDLIKREIHKSFTFLRSNEQKRQALLRSSSLPYCPLREFVECLTNNETIQEVNLESLTYMGIGTVIHNLFQNWLPSCFEKVEVLGNWNPKSINCQKSNCPCNSKSIAMNQDGCPECGEFPHYEELEFFGKFTSHIDGVYKIKDTNRCYIIDYKTTSSKKLMMHRKNIYTLPPANYKMQLDSYLVQLYPYIKKDLQIMGSLLIFISRDCPSDFEIVTVRESVNKKLIDELKTRFNRIADGWRLMGKIIKEQDFTMENAAKCSQHKLCHSQKYYQSNVHSKYNECPIHNICFNKKLKTEIEHLLKSK